MSYIITRGDVEITKNVLKEIIRRLGDALAMELGHFEYQNECPSYDDYQSSVDALVYLENNALDLTN